MTDDHGSRLLSIAGARDGVDDREGRIIVAKNRHGETGTIHAYYDRQYTRFQDADRVAWRFGE